MDSAPLHLELLKSGQHLIEAIAHERLISVANRCKPGPVRCRKRLGIACHKVERAAELYAIALRSYLAATLAELAPATPRRAQRAMKPSKCHMPGRVKTDGPGTSGQGRGHSEEGFAAPARLAKPS